MPTLIFDLDGVIWLGDQLVSPRVPALIKRLRAGGNRIFFLTNNSTRSQADYRKKLARLGIKAGMEEIICSVNAVRLYLEKIVSSDQCPVSSKGLKTSKPANQRTRKPAVFVIGEKPLEKEVGKLPVKIVSEKGKGKIDYVVVGADWHLTYRKLAKATEAILAGAQFIASNNDKTYPLKGQKIVPGCGAIVAALKAATNRSPYVVGKPNPFIIKGVPGMSGLGRGNTFMVGDRLDTDIELAARIGVSSILVLSGTTSLAMARGARGLRKPDYIIKDVTQIEKILKSD